MGSSATILIYSLANALEDRPEGLTITLSTSLEVPPLMDLEMAILVTACRMNYGAKLNPLIFLNSMSVARYLLDVTPESPQRASRTL